MITSKRELAIIIAIFSKYNLNTTKHLNFLDFEKAFLIYFQNHAIIFRVQIKPVLDEILLTMNTKINNFEMAANYKMNFQVN